MAPIGYAITTSPKLRRNAMVNDVPQHVGPLPVFYEPKGVTAKLKIVSPLVNAKRIMSFYVDSTLDIGDEIIN